MYTSLFLTQWMQFIFSKGKIHSLVSHWVSRIFSFWIHFLSFFPWRSWSGGDSLRDFPSLHLTSKVVEPVCQSLLQNATYQEKKHFLRSTGSRVISFKTQSDTVIVQKDSSKLFSRTVVSPGQPTGLLDVCS